MPSDETAGIWNVLTYNCNTTLCALSYCVNKSFYYFIIYAWSPNNPLVLNPSKSQMMVLGMKVQIKALFDFWN